jgi:hypothetical protein
MEDNPGADIEDDVFEAPSPIEMELHGDSVHAGNPTQVDVDSRHAQQTPPHRHDSEQGILDRSKNIYLLFHFLKMFFISASRICILFFLHTIILFFYFAATPHLYGNISNIDEILGFFLIRHLA